MSMAGFNALHRASLISTSIVNNIYNKGGKRFQCPTSGFPHFYCEHPENAPCGECPFQCPTSGFPHFYADLITLPRKGGRCFNALHRASLISTKGYVKVLRQIVKRFNALHRASLISTISFSKLPTEHHGCFNALHRASLISTSSVQKGDEKTMCYVSMPYIGLPSFLQYCFKTSSSLSKVVSMPYIGLPSFLRGSSMRAKENDPCVSMPYIGLPSFLLTPKDRQFNEWLHSFNALHRASLISTSKKIRKLLTI